MVAIKKEAHRNPMGTGGLCCFVRLQLLEIAGPLLAVALAGESFFCAAFLSWLQVKRMPLDFFYDVFLLNFALEATQCTFKRLAILQMDFCQLNSPPSGAAR